jgi:hypothetical protein
MNKQCKVHPKTFTKINKQLNTINNYNIIQLGIKKLYKVFTKKEHSGKNL